MNPEFKEPCLNDNGILKCKEISMLFDKFLDEIHILWGNDFCGDLTITRDDQLRIAKIVSTKLEEACFYAKKMVSLQFETTHDKNSIDAFNAAIQASSNK